MKGNALKGIQVAGNKGKGKTKTGKVQSREIRKTGLTSGDEGNINYWMII